MSWATACFFALAAAAPVVVMVDKPVTVAVAAPERVRHAKIVFLRMEGVLVRRNAPAVWNVFWDLPQANAATPVDDMHFAGYLTSVTNSAVREPHPANFTLELPAAAVAELQRHDVMRFTFVPVRKLPEGGVTITSLRLD